MSGRAGIKEAEAITLVHEAADKYFIGNSRLFRKLEAQETSLGKNVKIVILEVRI